MQTMTITKPRILYVDEDAGDSFTLATMLKLANYEPVTANYASDALQIAQCEEFDLYLLSRRFPIGSGEYLCQRLHEIAPQTPIIFLSDASYATGQVANIRSGSDEYIAKSKDAREIIEAVRLVLSEGRNAGTALTLH
jgi:DNA-binding response OmpR family regulator